MSWDRWLTAYAKDISVRGFTLRSRRSYSESAAAFVAYLETHGIDHPYELTHAVLEAYQAHLFQHRGPHGHRLTLSTQARHLAIVRSFCGFLSQRGAVLVDPSLKIVLPKVVRKLPRSILTRAEVIRFLRSIPTRDLLGVRDRATFETLYSTGLRVSELINLVPPDVDLDDGFLVVRAGKGGRGRVVPLGRIAAAWIRRYLELSESRRSPTDPLFVSLRGTPLIGHQISARARRLAARIGIKKTVTCHVFRHTCATHMLQGRASLRHIQELLGHKTPTSTQIYSRVSIQDLKKVHQRCHPRNRK